MTLVSITRGDKILIPLQREANRNGAILLVKPPYFSPWTPPLGISILKTFLRQHGFKVKCWDLNTDPDLWGMHHKYFSALQTLEGVSINDGYSKLWWILNAHMLAYANGGSPSDCAKVLERITPYYGIAINQPIIQTLVPLVDQFFKCIKELIDEMDLSVFSTVGTSTYTTSLGPSLFLLKHIKNAHPNVKTVMGGGVFADDLALESDNLDTLVREYDFVDHVILGEGELLLLKLLQGEFADKRVISLAALNGNTLQMKDVPIPDFSDTNPSDYYHLSIEGARSCPFQCSFCSETIQWGEYRKKPINLFAQQVVDLAQRYQNNSFFMGDSLMNPYINPFATKLLEMNASILYDGYLRADKPVTHRDFVKRWADSGCYRVRLGIESAAARVLNSMDKMTTPKVISDVLKTLANEGIRTTTYWIVGFPGETEEDFQETCEFIREHHRFIYELEAHPYYFYPYGQIGSRLYQCYSLYPEEVTDILKFKVWDIIEAQPTRTERYDRLRRISKLASDLDLPNIYTMAERYYAERRWHMLYPNTVEVYEGTRIKREKPGLSESPIEVFAPEWRSRRDATVSTDDVLSYRILVNKRLDQNTLAAAIRQVIESREMLQMRLDDGKFIASPLTTAEYDKQSVIAFEEQDAEAALSPPEIVARVSAEMRPEPTGMLRVVVIQRSNGTAELLLLAHKAIVDGRSLVLLCEDLYRAYEQLLNSKEVSLNPVKKNYSALVAEMSITAGNTAARKTERHPDTRTAKVITIQLDRDLQNRLSEARTRDYRTPVEIISNAVLGLLAQSGAEPELRVDSRFDYRLVDEELKDTVAPLTFTRSVPEVILYAADSRSRAKQLRRFFKETETGAAPPSETAESRVLLNLEYFAEAPWLGGDQFVPQGFIATRNQPREPYTLEISPVFTGNKVQVELRYRATAALLAHKIETGLNEALAFIFQESDERHEADQFWRHELGSIVLSSNLEMFAPVVKNSALGWTSVPCSIDHEQLERACSQVKSEPAIVLLSALSVVLSRLNGREDVVILTSINDAKGVVPVRLNPFWNLRFGEFAQQVSDKSRQCAKYAAGAQEAIEAKLSRTETANPVLDVGCILTNALAWGREQWDLVITQNLALVLELGQHDDDLSLCISYERSRIRNDLPVLIDSYLETVLLDVMDNPNRALGDIVLEKKQEIPEPAPAWATDVFNF